MKEDKITFGRIEQVLDKISDSMKVAKNNNAEFSFTNKEGFTYMSFTFDKYPHKYQRVISIDWETTNLADTHAEIEAMIEFKNSLK